MSTCLVKAAVEVGVHGAPNYARHIKVVRPAPTQVVEGLRHEGLCVCQSNKRG